ncbi:methionine--tRNA ligase [bacterium]|nr:methionine--tRNA ligase [bacterium]|tara:strand:- start:16571 stop:17998 length:1428 start_codon:yes stop_codon:yes gene_type:complete
MHKARYITTTLPYVNSDPHIGFALEIVQADALARYWRLTGHDVFFSTGTDEHGQKILQKAQEEGRDVQEYVDHYAGEFQKLKDTLGLSYDAFIRTTDEDHKAAAQELWKRCEQSGDIYKKKYKGLYCVGCELFLKDSDLADGKCPNHPTQEPQEIEEENYFFKLTNYKGRLLEYLSNADSVIPDWRREEAITLVNNLEDLSISRDKERLSWGVPVPGDDSQVMYVWFDALTNYISTTGWPEDKEGNFKKFWDEGYSVQTAGKDQVRFQSVIWQAMLMSGGVPTTDSIFYHGFITSDGQKMSKSIGNVISPFDVVEKYGLDATRYMLLRHVHPVDDSDITWERLDEWYEAHLVNGYGNLVSRIMKLAETHLDTPIEQPEAVGFPKEYTEAIDKFDFNAALDYVWRRIGDLDEKITTTEPFKLVKENEGEGKKLIAELAEELYLITRMLNPFMSETNTLVKKTILENKKPENLFPRL